MSAFFRSSFMASVVLGVVLGHPLEADTFAVDNLNDSGTGSLRSAIESANANPGMDSIEFTTGLSGTVTLASALPLLGGDLDILGPGAQALTVSGNALYRPFTVTDGVTVTIFGLSITNGQAEFGGAISNQGTLNIVECVLSGNAATFAGGAIDNVDGNLMISQSTLTGNMAGENGFGGGVSNDATGTLGVVETTFADNSAGFSGGAIDNIGTLTISRSTFSGNASEFGGAIENAGSVTVLNSTLSGNSATSTGGGFDNFQGTATLVFTTVTGNGSPSGGGIENTAVVTVKNSLVVNSTSGADCFNDPAGTFEAQGANFATDASCPGFTQSTSAAVDLATLQDNGGPTRTHALQPGSVAIDSASDCTLTDGVTPVPEDQRLVARPQGSACDSGAFEVSGSPSDIIFADGFESI